MVLFHLFILQCTIIPPKIRVLIDLFLLFVHDHSTKNQGCHYFLSLHTTIRRKYMILFHLFFLCVRPSGQKSGFTLIYFLCLCTTIRPKTRVLINLFLIFAHDHSTEICDHLSLILSLCQTIRPKIKALINLFCLFVQDHSAKVRGTLTV